jgi:outer membrane receptor protein involved in Fe transport
MKSLRSAFLFTLPTLLLLFLPEIATAQTGTISGTVNGEQGEPIGFAQVVVEGTSLGAVTDADGTYTVTGVPAGSHTLRTEFLGYRPQSATVQVSAGGSASQDFVLGRDYLGMETIVATAQREPRIKLETSTAITTLQPQDIERQAPRGPADLLKVVPGFYIEDSGGDVNNNLFARGMPADGSFRYVALLEDGMPIYDSTELSFLNADVLVRIDKNIRQVEAVRGGSASLFGSNAPGGLVNFVSKTGGPERAGVLEFDGGEAGLFRIDGNVNGPAGDSGWRYSVGGFYRSDEGIRDPGFTGIQGGQIKANLGRSFDNGYIRIYGKYLNDDNVFYLPAPLQNPDDPEFVPGFPSDGTMTSAEGIDKRVPTPDGEILLDLSDGLSQDGGHIQVELGFGLGGGWTIENNFRWMDYEHDWNAMLPFNLVDAQDFAEGFVEDTPGGTGFNLFFTETGEDFDTANGLLSTGGQWWVSIPLSAVSDQLALRKEVGAHNFTVGTYLGHYEADPTWRFNNIVTNVQNAPRFVDLEITDATGGVIRRVTSEGFTQFLDTYVNAEQQVDIAALFVGDEIAVSDRFDVDLGARFEYNSFEVRDEIIDTFDLPGGTDAHANIDFGTGQFQTIEEEFDEWAFSIGGNYRLSDQVSVYGRGTSGFKMPILDNVRSAGPTGVADLEAEDIAQVEGGIKVGSPKVGLSAVAYWLQIQNFPSQDVQIDPDTGETEFISRFAGEARTIGAEIEVVAAPIPQLRLNGTATLQNPEYTEFFTTVSGECQNPAGDLCDIEGNRIRRIPETILQLGAAYDIGNLNLHGDLSHIGERFSNNENTIVLEGFSILDLGAAYRFPLYGVTVRVAAKNVTDEGAEALTEGNPRVDETVGAQSTLFLARPVLPRRLTAGISYEF